MSRRLPVYLLIDSSGSMQGEPIQSVNVGIQSMLSALRQDPYALESVHLSLITFDNQVKEVLPLTPLDEAIIDDIVLPKSGATHLGEALNFLIDKVRMNVMLSNESNKGDFRPLLFIMTDGSPSDLYVFKHAVPELKKCTFGSIIACAAGPKANVDYLKELTSTIVVLENMESGAFAEFFKWVSSSIAVGSQSSGLEASSSKLLPPPPAEFKILI